MRADIGAPSAGSDAGPAPLPYLAGITAPPGGTLLGLTVSDVEYASASDELVFVSHLPTNAIHIHSASTDAERVIPVPLAPTAISLSGDQSHAIVGHDGWIGYVDLAQEVVLKMCPLPTSVHDLVLAPNGFAYVFPHKNGDYQTYAVNLDDCSWNVVHQGLTGTFAKLNTAGTKIYAADSSVYEIDVLPGGPLSYLTVHEPNVPYPALPLGRAFSREVDALTTELILGDGSILDETASGVSLVGHLPDVDYNHALVDLLRSHSGKTLTILSDAGSGSRDGAAATDGSLVVFDGTYLPLASVPLPAFQQSTTPLYSHGRLLFERTDGTLDYVIVATDMVDATSGNRAFGIVRLTPP